MPALVSRPASAVWAPGGGDPRPARALGDAARHLLHRQQYPKQHLATALLADPERPPLRMFAGKILNKALAIFRILEKFLKIRPQHIVIVPLSGFRFRKNRQVGAQNLEQSLGDF